MPYPGRPSPPNGPGLSGSGLYNALGRAFRDLPSLARLSLCPPEALRWVVGGANMTILGGAGTPCIASVTKLPVLVAPASIIGSELSRYWAPAFCFPPSRCRKGCLMYTRATSLPDLYIRNIIPNDMASPFWSASPYRGGAIQTFTPA
jgi:hypothetical protein